MTPQQYSKLIQGNATMVCETFVCSCDLSDISYVVASIADDKKFNMPKRAFIVASLVKISG